MAQKRLIRGVSQATTLFGGFRVGFEYRILIGLAVETLQFQSYLIPFTDYKGTFMGISDGSNYVRSSMFDRSKPKIGFSSAITKRRTHLILFDVRKNDVRVC